LCLQETENGLGLRNRWSCGQLRRVEVSCEGRNLAGCGNERRLVAARGAPVTGGREVRCRVSPRVAPDVSAPARRRSVRLAKTC
jgi:hypothetical protein